ncbi:MAG: TIGR00159 family protein [Syntrophomonadaceae bacterium]|nr:TIGR00159 family protein [Syntrophomonadaceae bacterium]
MDFSFLSGILTSSWNLLLNLVDIAIVAYLIYRILGLISGTRAEQLLRGILLLLVFSVLASFLNLAMVTWLVEKLWIVFAITLPIVFQPELRRFLEQIGRGSFFSGHIGLNPESIHNVLAEVSQAAGILSRNRMGALIVLARETGIGEYAASGVLVDAAVTSSLLVNVFWPNSPLHDGAVVISGGRLERAACFLPLSDNPNLSLRLGTRHRAGLGITEVSDALAVIVSEETGQISLAREGDLLACADENHLRQALELEFMQKPHWGESLRRRWFRPDESTAKAEKDRA